MDDSLNSNNKRVHPDSPSGSDESSKKRKDEKVDEEPKVIPAIKKKPVPKLLAGPNSEYVKLVSNDGYEFIILREWAEVSGTIRAMLNGPGTTTESESVVDLSHINGRVLEVVCKYLAYRYKYTDYPGDIPEFPVPPDVSVDLLLAANFIGL